MRNLIALPSKDKHIALYTSTVPVGVSSDELVATVHPCTDQEQYAKLLANAPKMLQLLKEVMRPKLGCYQAEEILCHDIEKTISEIED